MYGKAQVGNSPLEVCEDKLNLEWKSEEGKEGNFIEGKREFTS